MEANGVEPTGYPTWVPEDCSLNRISVLDGDDTTKFVATYLSSNRGELFVRVTNYGDNTFSFFEKNNGGYIFSYNNIDFNIMDNLNSVNIEWQIDNCVFSITGQMTSEETESIITSVSVK